MSDRAISDYALLSDCQTAALVSKEGSVDWLCLPHFDVSSVLGRILGPEAGHWSLQPADTFTAKRRYLERTMVLESEFATPAGTVTLTDALASGLNEREHALGQNAPHLLLRVLTCTEGTVRIAGEFAPRPEFGLVRPLLIPIGGGLRCHGGPRTHQDCPRLFRSSFPTQHSAISRCTRANRWHSRSSTSRQAVSRRCGARARSSGTSMTPLPAGARGAELHQGYRGPWDELVHHSGRVLQALTFQPTGAIVAVMLSGAALRGRRAGGPGRCYIQFRRAACHASCIRVVAPATAIMAWMRRCTVRRLSPIWLAMALSATPATRSDSS